MIKCCYLCERRAEGCHAVCKNYIEESEQNELEKREYRKIKELEIFHVYGAPGNYRGDKGKKKIDYYTRGRRA